MFVVKTQILENYGAHSESGRYAEGNAYWKMKGGNDFIVKDLDRSQDAIAFVMAAFSENGIHYKEFPTEVITFDEWEQQLSTLDSDYREFLIGQAFVVSPKTGTQIVKGV
jgi:hypothetical protein